MDYDGVCFIVNILYLRLHLITIIYREYTILFNIRLSIFILFYIFLVDSPFVLIVDLGTGPRTSVLIDGWIANVCFDAQIQINDLCRVNP